MGPGLVTGAADDDPSGIATYSQAGAGFGLGLLWTSLVTLPLMAAVQEICDRTALATGRSLGALAAERFSRRSRAVIAVLLGALLIANTLNIAADLVAVGEGMQLLHAGPSTLWAFLGGVVVIVLVVRGSFDRLARVFKLAAASLLVYLVVPLVGGTDWGAVGRHLVVPHLEGSTEFLQLFVAVLGTTISPYLFFWQSAHRIEELREEPEGGDHPLPLARRSRRSARRKQQLSRADVFTGMALSNLVMVAVIVSTASTLGQDGHRSIDSAAEAAEALRPAAGSLSSVLFALGFIATGMLAVPVLAGSASAGLAGLLGKPWGFSRSVRAAPVFYALVAVGLLAGTGFTLAGADPISLLIVVGIVNGVTSAPFLVVVLLIAGDRRLMGEYRNGRLATTIGWLTAVAMALTSAVVVVSFLV